ncbi:MAG: hypothetical protein II757_05720 [Bacteroidales bacterium]|nr:hypothetical protein [Bacteroidales bacterium]
MPRNYMAVTEERAPGMGAGTERARWATAAAGERRPTEAAVEPHGRAALCRPPCCRVHREVK